MDWAILQENINRLQRSIRNCATSQGFADPSQSHASIARRISDHIPLSNGAAAKKFALIVESERLLCQSRLPLDGEQSNTATDEARLGTADYVFLFAAPFLPPHTECGFLFKRELEDVNHEKGSASPFDSGALIKVHKLPEPAQYLREHEVRIPEHRVLLRESLDRLFEDPWHYVEGKSPRCASYFGLTKGDARRFTHEVRVRDEVSVKRHIESVFIARGRGAAEPKIERYLEWCDENSVNITVIPNPRQNKFRELRKACLAYIREQLAE